MIGEINGIIALRAASMRTRDKTASNARYALKAIKPVLELGVRAASTATTWERFSTSEIERGIKAATICQRLNAVAAVLQWVVNKDVRMRSMGPQSVKSVLEAMRTEARRVGKMVKRHRALSTPARVDLSEYPQIVAEIEALKEPYRSACRVAICFGTRIEEALSLSTESIVGGRIYISQRVTKTRADLLLPLPVECLSEINDWLEAIGNKRASYNGFLSAITRAGYKWRAHDLRKIFRTACAVRGEDYIACEMILNHELGEIPAVYLQKPPFKAMRRALGNSVLMYHHARRTGELPEQDE